MKPTAKRHVLIVIGMLAAVTTVNLAAATPAAEAPRSRVVRYADLDLSRPEDARRLYGRIKRAARAVCDNEPFSDLERLRDYDKCLRQAVTEAVEKLHSEEVSAIPRTRDQRQAGR
jgi:UrcA family protein